MNVVDYKAHWNYYLYVCITLFTILLTCYGVLSLTSSPKKDPIVTNTAPLIIYREEWGARDPKLVQLSDGPVPVVVIRETKKPICLEQTTCMEQTMQIQNEDIINHLSDISYNFLIGGDGNVYVGRGWDVTSAYSNISVDIAFHGNFQFDTPYPNMIQAAKMLIDQGVEMQYIQSEFIILCQNQTALHESEARHLCGIVKKCPHYDNNTYFDQFYS